MKKNVSKLLAVLLALLLLAGCAGKADPTVPAETAAVTEPLANGAEFAPVEIAGIAAQTPYVTLYYPEEWEGLVTVKATKADPEYRMDFHTEVSGKDIVLFGLIFSTAETAEGFALGSLTQQSGEAVYVFAAMNEELPETWSEEEIDQFSSMQERINDLIMQLNETPGFSRGN